MSKHAELPEPNAENSADVNRVPRAPHAQYGRFALWVASASSLAIGVAGAVAYGIWFNHDQHAYVDAITSARQALGPSGRASPTQTTAWAGQVAQTPTLSASGTPGAETGLDESALSMQSAPQGAAPQDSDTSQIAAVRPSQGQAQAQAQGRCSAARNRSESTSHSKSKPIRNPFIRIATWFHRGNYRHHGTRKQPDNFSRP
jgi:hypothetical protein